MQYYSRLEALEPIEGSHELLAQFSAHDIGLPVGICPIPGEADRTDQSHPTARLLVAHSGEGERLYSQGGRTRLLKTSPGMIEVYEQGLSFDHSTWHGKKGKCVMLDFGGPDLDTLTHGALKSLPLRTHHEVFDDRVRDLTFTIAEEALQAYPNGRLYAQGLCVALIGLVAQRFATAPSSIAKPVTRTLDTHQRVVVAALIRDELSADLSLTRLADATGLSPYHFSRLFRATFGMSPHRYVQEQRLQTALESLRRNPKDSIADVALSHGFASQAHMTELMRRRFGVTPGKFRHSHHE